jgi:hypothetical protein
MRIKTTHLLALAVLSISMRASGQLLLQADQFGRPIRVHDFWMGGWEKSVTLFTDPHQVLFIGEPKFDAGFSEYEKTGTYTTYLWTFYPDDNYCRANRTPAGQQNNHQWIAACKAAHYRVREVIVDTVRQKVKIMWDCMMDWDADPLTGVNLPDRGLKEWLPIGKGEPFSTAVNRITSMLPRRQ